MQDPDDIHSIGPLDIENEVAPYGVSAVANADLIAGATTAWVFSDALECRPYLSNVGLGLTHIPASLREVPNRRKVPLSGRSETIPAHDFFAAMKASKSKTSGAPLSSPATRAARRAAIWVS